MDTILHSGKVYRFVDFLQIPVRIAPVEIITSIVLQLVYALLPSLQTLVIADFIDTALSIFRGGSVRGELYLPLFSLLLIIVYDGFYEKISSFLALRTEMKLTAVYRSAIAEKRARLKYMHIENNDTWDLISRVCKNPVERIQGGFSNIMRCTGIVLRVGSLLVILVTQVWWAGLAIVAISVPLFFLAFKAGNAIYEANKEAQKYTRRADYLKKVLQDREYVEERTNFSYTKHINMQWHAAYETARKINQKILTKYFIRMKGSSLITALLSILIIAILLFPLSKSIISIGMFTSLAIATLNLVQMMSWELSDAISQIAEGREYLHDLSAFYALSEQEGALDPPCTSDSLTFESADFIDVSFRYPGTERYILKNFNLHIEKGLHYAVVGINGAGKTTLTKLLTGLYDNFDGDIRINGISIHEYTQAQLKALFSVVYQDFARYYIPMRENIALGNMNVRDDSRILKAAAAAGLEESIAQLADGMDTPLGKIMEKGSDLSGGQWQRVALARSLYNPAKVRILDEPTASLDPVAESNVYEMFSRISAGHSTIFITHRLGAARLADIILVLDQGQVAEQGSHETLMEAGGIYAQMFEAQRSWYQ